MEFSISKSLEILERTPHVLHALLYNINDQWSNNDEGLKTWSAYNVIGHLVYLAVLSISFFKFFKPEACRL